MVVYFVGYIEAGKNKWGQKLSKELNHNFLDTRILMQERTGKTYSELLSEKELFISTEQQIVKEISNMENTIIATSELLPCRNDNMNILNKNGTTIYLRAGIGCIMMRVSLKKNDIALLKGIDPNSVPDFINAELIRRKVFYEKAHINVLARELTLKKLLKLLEK